MFSRFSYNFDELNSSDEDASNRPHNDTNNRSGGGQMGLLARFKDVIDDSIEHFKRKFGSRSPLVLFAAFFFTFFLFGYFLGDPSPAIEKIKQQAAESPVDDTHINLVNQTSTTPDNNSPTPKSKTEESSVFAITFFGSIFFYILLQAFRVLSRIYSIRTMSDQGGIMSMSNENPMNRDFGLYRNNLLANLRLSMMRREFTADDYDMLQMLDNNIQRRGISEQTLSSYPTYIYEARDSTGAREYERDEEIDRFDDVQLNDDHNLLSYNSHNNNNNNNKSDNDNNSSSKSTSNSGQDASCSICLAPYSSGESIRRLPCLHSFHQDCIDPWLRSKSLCPICKFDLTSTGSSEYGADHAIL